MALVSFFRMLSISILVRFVNKDALPVLTKEHFATPWKSVDGHGFTTFDEGPKCSSPDGPPVLFPDKVLMYQPNMSITLNLSVQIFHQTANEKTFRNPQWICLYERGLYREFMDTETGKLLPKILSFEIFCFRCEYKTITLRNTHTLLTFTFMDCFQDQSSVTAFNCAVEIIRNMFVKHCKSTCQFGKSDQHNINSEINHRCRIEKHLTDLSLDILSTNSSTKTTWITDQLSVGFATVHNFKDKAKLESGNIAFTFSCNATTPWMYIAFAGPYQRTSDCGKWCMHSQKLRFKAHTRRTETGFERHFLQPSILGSYPLYIYQIPRNNRRYLVQTEEVLLLSVDHDFDCLFDHINTDYFSDAFSSYLRALCKSTDNSTVFWYESLRRHSAVFWYESLRRQTQSNYGSSGFFKLQFISVSTHQYANSIIPIIPDEIINIFNWNKRFIYLELSHWLFTANVFTPLNSEELLACMFVRSYHSVTDTFQKMSVESASSLTPAIYKSDLGYNYVIDFPSQHWLVRFTPYLDIPTRKFSGRYNLMSCMQYFHEQKRRYFSKCFKIPGQFDFAVIGYNQPHYYYELLKGKINDLDAMFHLNYRLIDTTEFLTIKVRDFRLKSNKVFLSIVSIFFNITFICILLFISGAYNVLPVVLKFYKEKIAAAARKKAALRLLHLSQTGFSPSRHLASRETSEEHQHQVYMCFSEQELEGAINGVRQSLVELFGEKRVMTRRKAIPGRPETLEVERLIYDCCIILMVISERFFQSLEDDPRLMMEYASGINRSLDEPKCKLVLYCLDMCDLPSSFTCNSTPYRAHLDAFAFPDEQQALDALAHVLEDH